MQLHLTEISKQLNDSYFKRHLFFLAATAITISLIGYHFGTFDEGMHIPFLKANADPTLYPGDPMIGLKEIYYSYFWLMFVPVLKAGWLEPTLFVVHIATIYLSFWAIWDLSETLFKNTLVSMLSVFGFIIPHFSFVGFPVFEFAPLSRTFVLPFLLFAVNQFFRGRIPLAFFIAGIMYNIHVVSVNFVLAMFGLSCLLEFRRIGIKNILLGGFLFILSALPVLLWKAGGTPVDFTLRPDWVDFLNKTYFLHIFNMLGPYPGPWVVTFSGMGALALFFIADPLSLQTEKAITARNFIYAGIIVVLVNIISVYFLPATIIIQSQIARIGLWILILAYMFFANYIVKLYQEKALTPIALATLIVAYIGSPTPILVVFVWWVIMHLKRPSAIRLTAVLTPLIILCTYAIVLGLRFWTPGIFIYGQQTPWVDVQDWARENTPKEARFITPPERWGVQESDWRVHSERSSAATFSELLVAAFQPGYEVGWEPRFELVAPGAFARFNGDYFANVKYTHDAYYGLSTEQLIHASCELDAQYIVIEKPHQHDLPLAYENEGFYVYDTTQISCP
jgi:hypothetical protein